MFMPKTMQLVLGATFAAILGVVGWHALSSLAIPPAPPPIVAPDQAVAIVRIRVRTAALITPTLTLEDARIVADTPPSIDGRPGAWRVVVEAGATDLLSFAVDDPRQLEIESATPATPPTYRRLDDTVWTLVVPLRLVTSPERITGVRVEGGGAQELLRMTALRDRGGWIIGLQ